MYHQSTSGIYHENIRYISSIHIECILSINNKNDILKIGVHQQGDLLDTDEFIAPKLNQTSYFSNAQFLSRDIHKQIDKSMNIELTKIAKTFINMHLSFIDKDTDIIDYSRCFYTNTIDGEFIVGTHPDDNKIFLASGFQGEGFKFAPIIGELLSKLVCEDILDDVEETAKQIFSPARF